MCREVIVFINVDYKIGYWGSFEVFEVMVFKIDIRYLFLYGYFFFEKSFLDIF